MPIGSLPGRLARGGKNLLSSTLRGLGPTQLDEEEYEQRNPQQAYWRGLSRDLGNAIGGAPYQGLANREAMAAERYNELGPERLREQQEAQRQAAQQERQNRMGALSEQAYMKYAEQAQAAGQPVLPPEAWASQLGHKGSQQPSAVQEYEYYKDLSDDERVLYQQANSARAGLTSPELAQLMLEQGRTKSQYEEQTEAQMTMDEAEAKADEALSLIDRGLAHAGFDAAYGYSGILPSLPESDRADFESIREQVGSQAFLDAFERLKGAGQITEREGIAATAAMTRILNTKVSSEAAREAWVELRSIISKGLDRKRAKAGVGAATRRFNPQTGAIEDI